MKQQSASQFPAQDPVCHFLSRAQRSVRAVCPAQRGIHSMWDFSVRCSGSLVQISPPLVFPSAVNFVSVWSVLGQAQLQAPLIPAPVSQQVRLFFPLLFLVRWQGIGDVFVSCAPLIQYPIEL
jgi:hypothetical protein